MIAWIKLSVNGHPLQIQSEYPQGAPGNVCSVFAAVLSPCLTSASTRPLVPLKRKTVC